MGHLIISLLWLLIYAVIFCGVVYLVLYGINKFVYQLPPRLEQGIWFIVLILVLIAFVSLLVGAPVAHVPMLR